MLYAPFRHRMQLPGPPWGFMVPGGHSEQFDFPDEGASVPDGHDMHSVHPNLLQREIVIRMNAG